MKKNNKLPARTIILMILFAAILIAVYFFMRNGSDKTDSVSSMSEAEKLIHKDIQDNYPSTPREVVKLYSRITKTFYNDKLKDAQIEALAKQIRLLFDDELLGKNEYNAYLKNLKTDIKSYRHSQRIIMDYVIDETDKVKYEESKDGSLASLNTVYTVKEKSVLSKVYEQFLLRKDKDSNWKILGWKLTDSKIINPDK